MLTLDFLEMGMLVVWMAYVDRVVGGGVVLVEVVVEGCEVSRCSYLQL
jgi:hypothetical protein